MSKTPIEVRRIGATGLAIVWSDGDRLELDGALLRRNCPCAECRELRGDISHSAPLSPKKPTALKILKSTIEEECKIDRIWEVGNYAIGIAWGDGHDTGIYTYQSLSQIGTQG